MADKNVRWLQNTDDCLFQQYSLQFPHMDRCCTVIQHTVRLARSHVYRTMGRLSLMLCNLNELIFTHDMLDLSYCVFSEEIIHFFLNRNLKDIVKQWFGEVTVRTPCWRAKHLLCILLPSPPVRKENQCKPDDISMTSVW